MRRKRLAEHALLFEEFLAREHGGRAAVAAAQAGGAARRCCTAIAIRNRSARSARCRSLLKRRAGTEGRDDRIELLRHGGRFGYGADTIDVSLAMGELSLLPAVRKAAPDDIIVADGTSCRHQIHDGAGREAIHVARVLAGCL